MYHTIKTMTTTDIIEKEVILNEIHDAVKTNDLEKVKALLSENSETVDLRDEKNRTPLHHAAQNGYPEIAELLIDHGANVNAEDNLKQTPRDLAIENDKKETAGILKANGGKETPVKDPEITHPTKNSHRITFLDELRPNITAFTGPDGILLVDTGLSKRYIKKINTALKKNGGGEIKYIINTHRHWDHATGNSIARDDTIIIDFHRLEKMKDDGLLSRAENPLEGKKGKTFETYYTMNFNGEEIRLIPCPGIHSDSDVIVHFTRSRVVCMGDLLLNGSFPVVGENALEYLELLEKVIDVFTGHTTFICGHGPEFTKTGLKLHKKMLLETVAMVREGMQAGKSIEDMQKENILNGYESHGTFIIKTDGWISSLYRSMQKPKI